MKIDYIEIKSAQSGLFKPLNNKKTWVKPDVEIVGLESTGSTPGGPEGQPTKDNHSNLFPYTGHYSGS